MSKLSTRILDSSDLPSYDDLIATSGRVFSQRNWLAVLRGKTTFFGLFNGSQKLIGATAFKERRLFRLPIMLRPEFTPFTGPHFSTDIENSSKSFETKRFFFKEMENYIKQRKLAICSLPLDPLVTDGLPFSWGGFKLVPAWTYIIDLENTLETIRKNYSSTRRRNIRAAKRDAVKIVQLDSNEIVEKLALNTFERQDKKLPKATLRKILFEFATHENSFAFAAFHQERPISSVFCVHDRNTAYYLIGGYDSENAHYGAGPACMDAAIEHSKSLGLERFDFEGSSIQAIEKYFRGFGGMLNNYFTINRAWLPLELLLKFKKRSHF